MLLRTRLTTALLLTIALLAAIVTLGFGDYPMSVSQVVRALVDPSTGFDHTVVVEWRLPRVVSALLVGACLGVSGAIFQSLTANPLGSPDVIGFSTGAYTGALIAMTVLGLGLSGATAGAIVGGLGTAAVVYLLAFRQGVLGFRLVVVGVGVTAMMSALNTWLLMRAQLEVALGAAIWGAGSFSLTNATDAWVLGGTLVVSAIALRAVAPSLRQLELGDDTSRAHGVRVEPARLALLVVGVVLVAVPTALVGPIAFIALAAPQVAARVTRSAGLPLVASAAVGALVLVLADAVAQHVLPGGVPVGTVTVVIGGCYLVWLLAAETRRR
ncbi:iron chelate uptake ABC transporter family permease subunit [Aeromicrobium sp. YIM 150415]|uniref:FecCD family ABC transporter permease n=1 Tax=Aeromicrobium sp. YIM 150415 TaxID=2803912 RepID=UPI00196398FF|nr:iron chelate uptake ABC transporter family permease subunit [Aeromicrobium sp. YIM 150415]MBM9464972.1 iron chelate uptake ABC transporter family permease subunit [Aeromicrobium sp. YIM 150415]